jgi:hypothetical protein
MSIYISSRLNNKEIHFQRVNVILGANGTGKSKLLQEIKENALQAFSITPKQLIYVEGGRTIHINSSLKLERHNFDQYQTTELAENTRTSKLKQGIAQRIQDTLILLDIKGQQYKNAHSDLVNEWSRNGCVGQCPIRKEPPLKTLIELFQEIFPRITLEFLEDAKIIKCRKNSSPQYHLDTLSDGEKQVFSLLADILLLSEKNSVVIVDEPELNLNPKLACKVWDIIENELTESIFIYASHSVSFTLRGNINKIFVLSSENENFSEISGLNEIGDIDLRELLGMIPTILSSSKILFSEGKDSSFDSLFYRWLTLFKNDFEVLPVGSSNDVKAITSRIGIWDKIAQNINLKGIIDRDFKTEQEVSEYIDENLTVLDFHEAESYLCLPSIAEQIGQKLNLVEPLPTAEDIGNIIFTQLDSQKLKIVAQILSRKANIQSSISLDRKSLSNVSNFEELEFKLIEKSKEQLEVIHSKIGEEKIKELISSEKEIIERIISDKNVVKALELLPGKELLNLISSRIGCKSSLSFLRSISKNINITEFDHLKRLSDKLLIMLN